MEKVECLFPKRMGLWLGEWLPHVFGSTMRGPALNSTPHNGTIIYVNSLQGTLISSTPGPLPHPSGRAGIASVETQRHRKPQDCQEVENGVNESTPGKLADMYGMPTVRRFTLGILGSRRQSDITARTYVMACKGFTHLLPGTKHRTQTGRQATRCRLPPCRPRTERLLPCALRCVPCGLLLSPSELSPVSLPSLMMPSDKVEGVPSLELSSPRPDHMCLSDCGRDLVLFTHLPRADDTPMTAERKAGAVVWEMGTTEAMERGCRPEAGGG